LIWFNSSAGGRKPIEVLLNECVLIIIREEELRHYAHYILFLVIEKKYLATREVTILFFYNSKI
jgi:hypothetical protein